MAVLKPCGTPAAYRRHLRNDEDPCDACRAAVRTQKREGTSKARKGEAAARLAVAPDVEVMDPDPLEVARSNLAIIEATLFSDSVSASAIKGLTERREQLVDKIIDLTGAEAAEVVAGDDTDVRFRLEAI